MPEYKTLLTSAAAWADQDPDEETQQELLELLSKAESGDHTRKSAW
jgi:hypothetical protein